LDKNKHPRWAFGIDGLIQAFYGDKGRVG
jgi:hypothetical protein